MVSLSLQMLCFFLFVSSALSSFLSPRVLTGPNHDHSADRPQSLLLRCINHSSALNPPSWTRLTPKAHRSKTHRPAKFHPDLK
ncbi:hypothetical protein F5883DRAFT_43709 [Diaporthe sp. PMI_573]|nr:hypothetical protein F5883DRAFT_43709 [Diaporthaceae sp. PMI_573]